jgi:hypothetical protein
MMRAVSAAPPACVIGCSRPHAMCPWVGWFNHRRPHRMEILLQSGPSLFHNLPGVMLTQDLDGVGIQENLLGALMCGE